MRDGYLRHGDAFCGIGGFGLAAQRAGWSTVWASEIEPSARAIYAERLGHDGLRFDGDIRTITDLPAIDILTGGFPCQDISVAGKRAGLDGERSSLFFELVRVLEIARPTWFVFENVDALLSSPDGARGRDFGVVLATLVERGYRVAWRVLNSRFFGLAQRRKRVFLVGHSTDWRCAASVLFESARSGGNPSPRRKARSEDSGADLVNTLLSCSGGYRLGTEEVRSGQIVGACVARGFKGVGSTIDGQLVAHTLTSVGADGSEDGTGRGSPIVTHPTLTTGTAKFGSGGRNGAPPVLIPTLTASGGQRLDRGRTGPEALIAGTVTASGGRRSRVEDARSSLVISENQRGEIRTSNIASALVSGGGGKPGQGYQLATTASPDTSGVGEASGLFGPLDLCEICLKGPDAPRYRGIGNAVSVPVIEWIFGRINAVNRGER